MSDLLEKVGNLLPIYKYHGLAPAPSAGKQRETFTVKQGSNGRTRTFRVKVDRPDLEGRLADLAAKGYNTGGEIQNMLGIPTDEAIRKHISPITDFYVGGDGTFVSLEPEFEGAVTLREFVDTKGGTLDTKTFNHVFRQVLTAQRAAIKDYGLYHRDLHAGNILINPETLEVRITDFTNAALVGKTVPKAHPTSGASFLRDPRLDIGFTGVERAYGEDSELYGLGVLALQLLTGKRAVIYDFEKRTAINSKGKSILTDQGRIDTTLHDQALTMVTLTLPRGGSVHDYWIRSITGFGTQGHERIGSIDDLITSFEKATRPNLLERIKNNKSVVAAATLTSLVLGVGASGAAWYLDRQAQEARVSEAEKYVVRPYWNGKGMEISNDKIDLRFNLTLLNQWYPVKDKILRAKAGDHLSLTATAKAQIESMDGVNNTTISLMGRYYIEGYPFADGSAASTFYVYTEGLNEGMTPSGQGGFYPGGYKDSILPQLTDGVYSVAVELYAPTSEEIVDSRNSNLKDAKLRFAEPGKAIVRKKVPLVIGEPKLPIDVYIANAGFADENWSARIIDDKDKMGGFSYALPPRDSFYVESFSPEVGFQDIFMGRGRLPSIADFKDATQANLYYALRNNDGQIINFTGMPIKRDYLRGPYLEREKPHYYVSFDSVGRDFAEKLVDARKSIRDKVDPTTLKKD